MTVIEARDLSRTFQRQTRSSGLSGAIRGVFSRRYETKVAVDKVSFDIGKGECVGYIGPNGAGKSTTIKMLTGILVPTSGEVRINQKVVHENRRDIAKLYGVVFGHRTRLWWDLPIIESYNLFRHIYRVPEEVFRSTLGLARELLSLDEILNTPVRQLSLGQRVRADLGAALLHDPQVLFLDEPTIGLDLVVKEKVRSLIRTLNSSGRTTVILATHDLVDIEHLCSRIIVINHGKLVYDGDLNSLYRDYAKEQTLVIEAADAPGLYSQISADAHLPCSINGTRIDMPFNPARVNVSEIIARISGFGPIKTFAVRGPSIEDVVRKIYLATPPERSPE